MKKALAIAALFMSISAHAAEELVKYEYNAGFSIRPGSETVTLTADGKVILKSKYLNRQTGQYETTVAVVARLNPDRVTAIKGLLPQIKESDLINQNEGEPMCTDAPSSQLRVVEGNRNVTFGRYASCHTWKNEQPPAVQLKNVMDGLVELSRIN